MEQSVPPGGQLWEKIHESPLWVETPRRSNPMMLAMVGVHPWCEHREPNVVIGRLTDFGKKKKLFSHMVSCFLEFFLSSLEGLVD